MEHGATAHTSTIRTMKMIRALDKSKCHAQLKMRRRATSSRVYPCAARSAFSQSNGLHNPFFFVFVIRDYYMKR